MRLHFDFSEYEDDQDGGTRVLLTVNLPDGEAHSRVTEIYEKAVSMLYGYDIKVSPKQQLQFNFDDDEEEDEEWLTGCQNCVQGTCVFNCGSEFK